MKVRNGFVSNSSSSSFIVMAETSLEVFEKMMAIWSARYDDWGDHNFAEYGNTIAELFMRRKKSNYNSGIMIPFTTNYETFISPSVNGKCHVTTCNNINWFDGDLEFVSPDRGGADKDDYPDEKIKFINIITRDELTYKQHMDLEHYKFRLMYGD